MPPYFSKGDKIALKSLTIITFKGLDSSMKASISSHSFFFPCVELGAYTLIT